jgi:hypothetical protein
MAMAPPGPAFSASTCAAVSPLMIRALCQPAESNVAEKTIFFTLFTHSACARSLGVASGLPGTFDQKSRIPRNVLRPYIAVSTSARTCWLPNVSTSSL